MLTSIDGNIPAAQRSSRRFGRAGKGRVKQRQTMQKHLRTAAEALEKPVPTWLSVRRWLEAEGCDDDAVEGTYTALVAAEIPESEWLAELQSMKRDGELRDFMHSIYVQNMVALLTYDRKAPESTSDSDSGGGKDGMVTQIDVAASTRGACEPLTVASCAASTDECEDEQPEPSPLTRQLMRAQQPGGQEQTPRGKRGTSSRARLSYTPPPPRLRLQIQRHLRYLNDHSADTAPSASDGVAAKDEQEVRAAIRTMSTTSTDKQSCRSPRPIAERANTEPHPVSRALKIEPSTLRIQRALPLLPLC